MPVSIPDSHKELLESPLVVVLATVMPNGQPQTTAVWCRYDGTYLYVVTTQGTQKEKNMQARPLATIIAIDPQSPHRYVEVRGKVESITEDTELTYINEMAQLYTGNPTYYGFIEPAEKAGQRTHVLCKISPTKVVTNG